MNKYPCYIVEWVDANYQEGPVSVRGLAPLKTVITLGMLIREDSKSVSLASEFCDEDDDFRDVTHIPKSCIVSIHEFTRRRHVSGKK